MTWHGGGYWPLTDPPWRDFSPLALLGRRNVGESGHPGLCRSPPDLPPRWEVGVLSNGPSTQAIALRIFDRTATDQRAAQQHEMLRRHQLLAIAHLETCLHEQLVGELTPHSYRSCRESVRWRGLYPRRPTPPARRERAGRRCDPTYYQGQK